MHNIRTDASGGHYCAQCGVSWDRNEEPPAVCTPARSAERRRHGRLRNQRVYQEEMAKIRQTIHP